MDQDPITTLFIEIGKTAKLGAQVARAVDSKQLHQLVDAIDIHLQAIRAELKSQQAGFNSGFDPGGPNRPLERS